MRMMSVRTACAVAHGIRRYTRAKTFTAIGRRQAAGGRRWRWRWRWRWRVFRRSPVNLVRPTLLVSTTRRIFGRAQNILHDKSATVRRPDRHTAWTSRRHGCGLRCRRSKPGGTATRYRSHHQQKGSRVWERDSLRCRIFDPYECFDGAHTSLPIRQPRCRCVLDTVRRCLQGGRPNGRRGLAPGVHDRRRETCGMGTHPARGAAMCFRRDER